jgi:hypothetical protein
MKQQKRILPYDCGKLLSLPYVAYEVGSRVTCDPPVVDTDSDWLVVVTDWQAFIDTATTEGFELSGSVPADELKRPDGTQKFWSLRRGILNLIVTDCPVFANNFIAATSVAKRLNLINKDDRIALFQAVLYGNQCEE